MIFKKRFSAKLLVMAVLIVISGNHSFVPLASAENQPALTSATTSQTEYEYDYVLFEDDFSISKNWVYQSVWIRTKGEYQIEVPVSNVPAGNSNYIQKAPLVILTNQYTTEADCRLYRGNEGGYCIVFNIDLHNRDFYNYVLDEVGVYFFIVLPFEQKYRVITSTLTGWKEVLASVSSPHIRAGDAPNHLKVFCNGNKVKLFVNNQFLNEVTIKDFSKDIRVGISPVSLDATPITVRFDNFKITVPKEAVKKRK